MRTSTGPRAIPVASFLRDGPLAMDERSPRSDGMSLSVLLTRAALPGLLILFTVEALIRGKGIAVPVVAALVLGSMLGGPVDAAHDRGVPPPVAATALLSSVLVALYFLVLMLAGPVSEWIGRAGEIGPMMQERLRFLERPLAALHELQASLSSLAPGDGGLTVGVKQSPIPTLVSVVTPALTELLIFFGTLFFYLADRRVLKQRLVSTLDRRETRLRALHVFAGVEAALRRYMTLVTLINAGLGTATAIMLALIGVPSPILWGAVAFVLNFIPYLGALITASILLVVGLFTFPELGQALMPPGLFVLIATIEGHFLTPGLIGRHLTLRPFFVFLALAFWTWLWGPIGAFLAVPLLIVGLVLKDEVRAEPDVPHLP